LAEKKDVWSDTFTEKQIEEIVDDTLTMVDKDGNGTVEYAEYEEMVKQSPATVLSSFTLNIGELCSTYKQLRRRHSIITSDAERHRRMENLKARAKEQEYLKEDESDVDPPTPVVESLDAIEDRKTEGIRSISPELAAITVSARPRRRSLTHAPRDKDVDELDARPVDLRTLSVFLGPGEVER